MPSPHLQTSSSARMAWPNPIVEAKYNPTPPAGLTNVTSLLPQGQPRGTQVECCAQHLAHGNLHSCLLPILLYMYVSTRFSIYILACDRPPFTTEYTFSSFSPPSIPRFRPSAGFSRFPSLLPKRGSWGICARLPLFSLPSRRCIPPP